MTGRDDPRRQIWPALLDGAEDTNGSSWDNTSGNPHAEDFLDVR